MSGQRWHKAVSIALATALVAMLVFALSPQHPRATPDLVTTDFFADETKLASRTNVTADSITAQVKLGLYYPDADYALDRVVLIPSAGKNSDVGYSC